MQNPWSILYPAQCWGQPLPQDWGEEGGGGGGDVPISDFISQAYTCNVLK